MAMSFPVPRRSRAPWCSGAIAAAWGLAGLLAASATFGRAEEVRLEALRLLAAREPAVALQQLAPLRQDAVAQGRLGRRLAVDELECRIRSDTDAARARQVAQAGAAALGAAATPDKEAQSTGFRLAACGAGVLLDTGGTKQGNAELDRLVALTAEDPAYAYAQAMALLERGLHRSRRNELVTGQADLLKACTILQKQGATSDLELCQWHLANHYKRTRDTEEALALLLPLLESARARQASADLGVYTFGVGQIRLARKEYAAALANFEESRTITLAARDRDGEAYAEHGIAMTLLHLGRAPEALLHVDHESALLADGSDPVQALRTLQVRGDILCALGRAAQALRDLDAHQAALDDLHDDALRIDWTLTRAAAQAQVGNWREAYADLSTAHGLAVARSEQQLSEQSARWRMQFNRERDAAELSHLRSVNAQGEQLRQAQALALALFIALLGLASWIAARKVLHARRMHRLAMLDELTGLPNRRAVLARLEKQLHLARGLRQPLSVLMLDVDHFKAVNDTHGHGVGDEVLRHVAGLLAGSMRSLDWVGRLGGEEFLAVLSDATPVQAATIAERMRCGVQARPCAASVGPLQVTVSVGIGSTADGTGSAEGLIERADACLYDAKRRGRNRVSGGAAEDRERAHDEAHANRHGDPARRLDGPRDASVAEPASVQP